MLDESDPEDEFELAPEAPSHSNASEFALFGPKEQSPDLVTALQRLRLSPTSAQAPTCYVYDSFMMRHRTLSLSDHVECPNRISRIYSQLATDKLLARCQRLPSRFAAFDELLLIHDETYLKLLIEKSRETVEEMIYFQEQFDSIYYCADSFKCASLAVGCLLTLTDAVLSGRAKNGFAIIRPPGHHADADLPSGFCLVNNVAVAVQWAIEKFGLKRVLIVNWDVHHGNGTQRIFYHRKDVLFVSLHRYDGGYFYPAKSQSNYKNVGEGIGIGYSVNIPWTGAKMGDAEYLAAFRQIIMPIAASYDPEVVFVSAGFDAALGDPLGGYRVSPEGYSMMTRWLTGLAGGKVILALEGGYNLTSVALSYSACVESLVADGVQRGSWNQPSPEGDSRRPCRQAVKTLHEAAVFLQQFWPCLTNHDDEVELEL